MKLSGKITIAAAAAIAAVVVWLFPRGADDTAETAFAEVAEGPLVINLTEAGSIKPREQIILKNQVEGRTSILSLIPEGTRVKKGDVLVELDISELETKRVDQEIVVQNAESATVITREDLEVVKNQAKADVEQAELDLRFAEEDLEKYREGEYPNMRNDSVGKVTLAEEELERARDKMEWSKKLFSEKYLSETELRSDELSWKRCELSLKTAKGDLALLENYTYKRKMAELESGVSQKKMALERVRRKANASVVQSESQLRAKELELSRQRERYAKFTNQIDMATIKAPMDGLVIYATSAQNRWRNQEPLAEGTEIRERQELIYLPTADTFQAEINVHESNLKKVSPGLPAKIKVDAAPGVVFSGALAQISPLPDPDKMWMKSDLKVYQTTVNINGGGDVLKSGMNCQVEIILEQYEKTMYIPVQCVTRVNGKPCVWIKTRSGTEMREIEIGLDNNIFVRVVSGLSAGDKVMLAPPLGQSVAKEKPEVEPGADTE